MWYLNIPKILHVYWGGGSLPYMRYLTVKTFIDINPGWEIQVWTPKDHSRKITWHSGENSYVSHCEDYFPRLLELPVKHNVFDYVKHGFQRNSSEVHKADYTRIAALNYYGGVWADMDIIFFRPIAEIYVNTKQYADKEVFVCIAHYGHSTGFLMARPDSKMFSVLVDAMLRDFNPASYQCIGPDLFNKYFRKKVPSAVNLSMDVVYSHDALSNGELLKLKQGRFTERSIGCHWYGGHPMWGRFIKETNGGLEHLPDNIISNLIKNGQLRNTSKSVV